MLRHLDQGIWPPSFYAAAEQANRRVLDDMGRRSPVLASQTLQWLALRCDLQRPDSYFTHPQGVPALALPWWLEESIRGEVDLDFQTDLMYSTISGYYFIRMLDDVMDGHAVERSALPALHAFHLQFVNAYHKYFPPEHSFWQEFERILKNTAESVSVETTLDDLRESEFVTVSARKPAAVAIPIAAGCFRYGRPDLLPAWENFFAVFARWHQMRDDLLDWTSDSEARSRTWLLCEAERRRHEDESVAMWMGREGFRWVQQVMNQSMDEALLLAGELNSLALLTYLQMRKESFDSQIDSLLRMAALSRALLALDPCNPKT
jgi:hypothetical protein